MRNLSDMLFSAQDEIDLKLLVCKRYDEQVQRTAYQRRYPDDDRCVVPHSFELAAYHVGTNVASMTMRYSASHANAWHQCHTWRENTA